MSWNNNPMQGYPAQAHYDPNYTPQAQMGYAVPQQGYLPPGYPTAYDEHEPIDYTQYNCVHSPPPADTRSSSSSLMNALGAQTLTANRRHHHPAPPAPAAVPIPAPQVHTQRAHTGGGSSHPHPHPSHTGQAHAAPSSAPSKTTHTFKDAGFDTDEALQRHGNHSEYDLGKGYIIPQAPHMGYGANAPGMKPPIEFKVRGKAGINLHEVIYRFDSKSMPGALNEEVRLGGEARKGAYFHVRIHWPGYFPQEIAVKIPADHKVKSSDEVTWVAMKLAEIVNEILVTPPKQIASGTARADQHLDLARLSLEDVWLLRLCHVGANNWQPVLLVVPPKKTRARK